MQYDSKDKYFHQAKQAGYRARSVYKLQAIQERFHILKSGDKVLDLGAAPGSFLQYVSTVIGSSGIAVGVDLTPIKPFKEKNIITFVGDVMENEVLEKKLKEIGVSVFNVITSDMAPATSGIRFLDGGRSEELNLQVIRLAGKYLIRGGYAVIKLLPGVNEGTLVKEMKKLFKTVRRFRPEAVRKTSGEFYLIGLVKIL
ncbi:MAG: RlmE family RNA methyltransferase [Candidatus Peregrinibacteria bacterium]